MTAALRHLGFIAIAAVLQACSSGSGALPTPLEPDQNSIAFFCHMSLPEHEGPKGQAFMRGKDKPIWFASASEAFVYLETEVFQPSDLRVLYVNDMSKGTWERPAPGAWIDIHKAVFVLGSSQITAMGDKEAVPFATSEAAARFVKQYGGTIADFDAAATALAVERTAGTSG
jgi:copper chaperone NosL